MTDTPIEGYLDELFKSLRDASARDARSLLAETEAHLRDLAKTLQQEGMAPLEAEAAAVRRFGDSRHLAYDDSHRLRPRLALRVAVTAWALGALGAVAIGASGLFAGLFRLVGMSNVVLAGQPSATEMTASACRRWLTLYPHATNCASASSADWAAETVAPRIAFGILGLVAVAALLLGRRYWPQLRQAWLPPLMVDTIATLAFAAGGIWLVGMGIDAIIVASGHGAGQWLSAAPVALAAATWFGFRLVRHLRANTSPLGASWSPSPIGRVS